MIILNSNVVNTPTKRQRLLGWIKKKWTNYMWSTQNLLQKNDIVRLKVKGKKTRVAILISENVYIWEK